MRTLICGAGIAGLTLAGRLVAAGHAVTLIDIAPRLRDAGYMIDFFGSGYDAAERMGLLPALEANYEPIARLVFVDGAGHEKLVVSYADFRRLFDGRHFNFMRGELERVLYERVASAVDLRWGTTIQALHDDGRSVEATFSDGRRSAFDLVVGADGIRSRVRALAFAAANAQCLRFLGYHTAAFMLPVLPAGLARDALHTLSVPRRQVGVYPVQGGRAAAFFVHKADDTSPDTSHAGAVAALRAAYGDLGWVVPDLLARGEAVDIYYDTVAQVVLPRWHAGRVVLVGDACQCVSLLAGQGASMAMAGAWVLAREIARAGTDLERAFGAYGARLQPAIERQQAAGRRIATWFVPDDRARVVLNRLATRLVGWPLAWRLVRRAFTPASIVNGEGSALTRAA